MINDIVVCSGLVIGLGSIHLSCRESGKTISFAQLHPTNYVFAEHHQAIHSLSLFTQKLTFGYFPQTKLLTMFTTAN